MSFTSFSASNPAAAAWLENGLNSGNSFAASLVSYINRTGTLTERQMAVVQRNLVQPVKAAPKAVTVDAIEVAFKNANDRGIKRPKLRLGEFTFSQAPAIGRNAGALYVKQGDNYLGKIASGQFECTNGCSDEQARHVVEAAANPAQSAVAYGRRTGQCAICARTLTVGESIDRGIGPICAEKFGFI